MSSRWEQMQGKGRARLRGGLSPRRAVRTRTRPLRYGRVAAVSVRRLHDQLAGGGAVSHQRLRQFGNPFEGEMLVAEPMQSDLGLDDLALVHHARVAEDGLIGCE